MLKGKSVGQRLLLTINMKQHSIYSTYMRDNQGLEGYGTQGSNGRNSHGSDQGIFEKITIIHRYNIIINNLADLPYWRNFSNENIPIYW